MQLFWQRKKWLTAKCWPAFGLPIMLLSCSDSSERYLRHCQSEFNKGQFDDAVLECRKAIQKSPSSGEAYYWLGLAYVKLNRGAEAYDALRSSVRLRDGDERSREAFADVALAALQESRNGIPSLYKEVAESSDWFLKRDQNSISGLRLKGSLAMLDKKPAEAAAFFQRAHTQKPGDSSLAVRLSDALFAMGSFAQGEQIALKLIEEKRSFGAAYDLLYDRYTSAKRMDDAERILAQRASVIWSPATIVQLALIYSKANKAAERDAMINRLITHKDYANGPIVAGDFYLGIGNAETAIQQYETGIKNYPGNRVAYQRKIVNALLTQRRDDEALQRAEELVRESPKDFEGRAMRAALLFERGQIDRALPEFKELIHERPKDSMLHYNFGRLYVAKKDWNAAIPEFQAAATQLPNFLPPRVLLAEINLLLGRPQEAVRWTEQIIAVETEHPRARLLHAIGMKETGRVEEARAELLKLLAQRPDSVEVKLQLGLVELARNRLSEAEKIFRDLSSKQDDERTIIGLSETLYRRDQPDQALTLLEQSIKKTPSLQLARAYAAVAARAGKYDLAIGQLRQEHLANPNSVEPLLLLGDAQRAKGDYAGALATFEQAKKQFPNNIGVLLQLAYTQQVGGNREGALELYRRVSAQQPNNGTLLNNMASLLAEEDTKSVEEALLLIRKALQSSPGNADYTDTLGMIYLRKNMTDSALQIFAKLVNQSPQSPTFHHHLGLALLQKGSAKEASAALQRALKNLPTKPEEIKIRETLARATQLRVN